MSIDESTGLALNGTFAWFTFELWTISIAVGFSLYFAFVSLLIRRPIAGLGVNRIGEMLISQKSKRKQRNHTRLQRRVGVASQIWHDMWWDLVTGIRCPQWTWNMRGKGLLLKISTKTNAFCLFTRLCECVLFGSVPCDFVYKISHSLAQHIHKTYCHSHSACSHMHFWRTEAHLRTKSTRIPNPNIHKRQSVHTTRSEHN